MIVKAMKQMKEEMKKVCMCVCVCERELCETGVVCVCMVVR